MDDNVAWMLFVLLRQDNQKIQKSLAYLTERIDKMSQTTSSTDQEFRAEFTKVIAAMTAQTTVTNSLVVFVQGLRDQLAAAIASAQTAGATADELADLKALDDQLSANTDTIQKAITDNTTSQGEPPAAVVTVS